MRLLFDTHVIIWYFERSPALSVKAKSFIENPNNDLYVSIASIWEMSIKVNLGKLKLAYPIRDVTDKLRDKGVAFIPIYEERAISAGMLPLHHRDPFDRMLISQANRERMTLVTRDEIFQRYDVSVMW